MTRNAAGTFGYYRNGALVSNHAIASVALYSTNRAFLQTNASYWTGQAAAGVIGGGLTSTEQLALYNALNAYIASTRIFAAFTTPPTPARQTLIQNAVASLMTAGVWDKLDALYMFAAADAQAAKVNWKNPGTYNASEVLAPTFTADQGFTGASTKYLDSGFNPTTAPTPQFVQNSAAFFAWSLTDIDAATAIFGPATATGSGESMLFPRSAGTVNLYINQGSNSTLANTDGSGFFTVVRRAASGASAIEVYRNTTSLGTGSIASVAPANQSFAFLKRGAAAFWTGQVAAGGFGSQLSAGEQLAAYNTLRTYLTGVGVP
jgi:hypothetical protein